MKCLSAAPQVTKCPPVLAQNLSEAVTERKSWPRWLPSEAAMMRESTQKLLDSVSMAFIELALDLSEQSKAEGFHRSVLPSSPAAMRPLSHLQLNLRLTVFVCVHVCAHVWVHKRGRGKKGRRKKLTN